MKIFSLVAVVLILLAIIIQRKQGAFRMNPEELKQKLDNSEPLTLVDVRNPDEYHGPLSHIKGAVLKPLGEIGTWTGEFTDSNQIVVVICLTGSRSAYATRMLRSNGVNAYNLAGGMNAWRRHGFPVH